jgi:hypothetical protein
MRPPHSHPFVACVAAALLLLFAHTGEAELFEWTDDDGRVHYTNEPRPGSEPVGLAPIALEAEEEAGSGESASDAARRDRLKRQRAERWTDSQEQFPTPNPVVTPTDLNAPNAMRPAAPALQGGDDFERSCQAEHGMSCLQFEAWLRSGGFDCETGPSGAQCRTDAKAALHKKARDKARKRLALEDEARANTRKPGDY